jgi:hypothetical protein
MLGIARKRVELVSRGFCGTHRNCGAAVGAGICISVITGSSSLSKEELRQSNMISGRSLLSIAAQGGPRCCKRDTYIALQESIGFLEQNFQVRLDSSSVHCDFSKNNRECPKEEYNYYLRK